jgi:hypothetical protein
VQLLLASLFATPSLEARRLAVASLDTAFTHCRSLDPQPHAHLHPVLVACLVAVLMQPPQSKSGGGGTSPFRVCLLIL